MVALKYSIGVLGVILSALTSYVTPEAPPTYCYSSNGGTRRWDDNGIEVECRKVGGYTKRFCRKLKTDSRPGLIFRECDHIYEQLFGYEELGHNKEEGCWRFEAMVNDKMETGIHCACHGDSCNGGDILESDVIEVNATTPVQP